MGYNDDYDEEDDLAALFVLGELYDEDFHRHRNKGGGCLTTALMIMVVPILIILACMGG